MEEKIKRSFSAEKKLEILREHLKNKVSISEICKRYSIHPTQFYKWEKQLFEGGKEIFSSKHKANGNSKSGKERKLEEKIERQKEVISWLTEENLRLKKNF
ncbi:MAG: transposase, partial [Thermoanaerobaculia bacterium]